MMHSVIGKVQEYYFHYKDGGSASEAFAIVKDVRNEKVYVCIFEGRANPEELNKIHNDDYYYNIEANDADYSIFDEEMLDTFPYSIQNEYESYVGETLIMVDKWNKAEGLDIFLF